MSDYEYYSPLDEYVQLPAQYSNMHNHMNMADIPTYVQHGTDMMGYGGGTVALPQVYGTRRPVNIVQRGDDPMARHRVASSNMGGAGYNTSSEPSPTDSAGHPELL